MTPVVSTEDRASSPHRILALIVAVFVLRAMLAIAIVPPWQHPDEPQHFEFVHILARQRQLDLSERVDFDLERSILSSMAGDVPAAVDLRERRLVL